MILFANCKINIGLDILIHRPDGYHDIETLMFPVRGLCDAVEVLPAPLDSFSCAGLTVDCPPEKNLCMKALHLLRQRYGIGPVKLNLLKTVPFGAGLGGGSSDAAHTIRLLDRLFSLNLPDTTLESLAAELGSDTAFFIRNRPAIASGRGEILTAWQSDDSTPRALAGKHLVILKPDFGVGTAEAYRGVSPHIPEIPLRERLNAPLQQWKELIVNAFEPSVFALYPTLKNLKEKLYDMGALYASLSGSGSALYGIFESPVPRSLFATECFVYQEIIK